MMAYYLLMLGVLIGAIVGHFTAKCIYNVYFHPLKDFPGPWYCKASRLWLTLHAICGTLNHKVKALHDIYGDTVRIAYNELSYSTGDAWQPICGRNSQSSGGATQVLAKDDAFYGSIFANQKTLVDAEGDEYKSQKRNIANGFAHKSLQAQELVVQAYTTRLVEYITNCVDPPQAGISIDLNVLFQNTNLDIISTFVLGKAPEASNHGNLSHPIVVALTQGVKFATIFGALRQQSRLLAAPFECVAFFIPPNFFRLVRLFGSLIEERLSTDKESKDLTSFLVTACQSNAAGNIELIAGIATLLTAGAESSPYVLCSTLYYLISNPSILQQLCKEVRVHFGKPEDITFASASKLVFLNACLNESMRMYPPTPGSLPRLVPVRGAIICNRFVPEGTIVGLNQLSTYRSSRNFVHPDTFIPERWLEDAEFARDQRGVLHPFGYGPRTCIAREYAMLSIRYTLARLLWEFDMKADSRSVDWDNQRGFKTWRKGPFFVRLSPVRR